MRWKDTLPVLRLTPREFAALPLYSRALADGSRFKHLDGEGVPPAGRLGPSYWMVGQFADIGRCARHIIYFRPVICVRAATKSEI